MVLDRMPDNFFAETEQVAFCPANIVPGIDFSNDPLLQGRLFSYLDTQLSRLGGPNFEQIPINAPKCPMHNFQRDGHMQTAVPKGRVAYEPNSLAPDGPRASYDRGFRTYPRSESGGALRVRPGSFADHYSQARLFYVSQTESEQNHIVSALVFELSKVEAPAIRGRMVANLVNVDGDLAARVAAGLGLPEVPAASPTLVAAKKNPTPSPALSIHLKAKPTIEGRVVGCIVTDGVDGALFDSLKKAVTAAGAKLVAIAPKIGGVKRSDGKLLPAEAAVVGAPSVLFDAVAVLASAEGGAILAHEGAAIDFVRDAFAHLKVMGTTKGAQALLDAAGLGAKKDAGVIALEVRDGVETLVKMAKKHRIWSREPAVRNVP